MSRSVPEASVRRSLVSIASEPIRICRKNLVDTEKSDRVAILAKRILKRQVSVIAIDCETWSFDEALKKVERNVRISILSKYHAHEMILITSLNISPLYFNPRSLRD